MKPFPPRRDAPHLPGGLRNVAQMWGYPVIGLPPIVITLLDPNPAFSQPFTLTVTAAGLTSISNLFFNGLLVSATINLAAGTMTSVSPMSPGLGVFPVQIRDLHGNEDHLPRWSNVALLEVDG